MASRISRETETRLVGCLEKMAGLVEGGMEPTPALVKIAREEQLGPGLVRLMSQAYNNGRTNAQRKSAEDLFDKSASFALADPHAAVEELYPSTVKTAAELHRQKAISPEYSSPPSWHKKVEPSLLKTASPLVDTPPPAYPREEGRHVKRAFGILDEAKRDLAERRRVLSETRDKLASAFGDLRTYFRRIGVGTSVKQAQVNSRLLFGKPAEIVFQQLCLDDPLVKKASEARDPRPSQAKADQAPYRQIGECIKLARECSTLAAGLDEMKKEASAATKLVNDRFVVPDPVRHSGSILRPMEKAALIGDIAGHMLGKGMATGLLNTAVGGAALTAGGEVMKRVMPKDIGDARNDAFLNLTSPEHEAKLRNIRSQAVLHDIMANDDYLSGEHPEKVVKMYNEITKLSPRAADQPMLMRSLLRQYMQQPTVGAHDISQQLDIENKIKDRDEAIDAPPPVGGILGYKGKE